MKLGLFVADNGDALHQAKLLVARYYLNGLKAREQGQVDDPKIAWPANTHILLVEDNIINQEVAKCMLKSLKLTVNIAAKGLDAIYALQVSAKDYPYNLIIMDCQMPEMDG
jgi:two-component system sensor histidine kinase/response regulator